MSIRKGFIAIFLFCSSLAQQVSNTECPPQRCQQFQQKWDKEQCKCINVPQCKKKCPEEFMLHPHYKCRCVRETLVDELEIEWEVSAPIDFEDEEEEVEECTVEKKCNAYNVWNWNKCACTPNKYCRRMCPSGQGLHPDYTCKCVDQTEIEERLAQDGNLPAEDNESDQIDQENQPVNETQCQPYDVWNGRKCAPRVYCSLWCGQDRALHPAYSCKCVDKAVVTNYLANYNKPKEEQKDHEGNCWMACAPGFVRESPGSCKCVKRGEGIDFCYNKVEQCKPYHTWDVQLCACVPMGGQDEKKCETKATCDPYHFWEWDRCGCQKKAQCEVACPWGQKLHPDYECKCVDREIVKDILGDREHDKPVREPHKCMERRCSNPLRMAWDPTSCICAARINCMMACVVRGYRLHPDRCECVPQAEIDQYFRDYQLKWDKIEKERKPPKKKQKWWKKAGSWFGKKWDKFSDKVGFEVRRQERNWNKFKKEVGIK